MAAIFKTLDDPRLIRLIVQGGVGIIPTDTVYGLVGSVSYPDVATRIHGLKKRQGKLGTIIASSIDQLESLGIEKDDLAKVAHLWPNSISIVMKAPAAKKHLSPEDGTLAVRIPNDTALLNLLTHTGPLVTSSANLTGDPPAETVEQAQEIFGDAVDYYVLGPPLRTLSASTIVRYVSGRYETLRNGTLTVSASGTIINSKT